MTILFVGNTLSDFFADASSIGMTSETTTNVRDSSLSPNELQVPISAVGSSPFGIELEAEYTDLWVHFRADFNGIEFNAADGSFLNIYDGSDDLIASLDFNNDAIRTQAVGDTTVTGESFVWSNAPITIDVHVEVSGGNIVVTFYRDGSVLDTVTAANTGGKGGGQTILFSNEDVTNSTTSMYFSEFIVTNAESTRGWRLGCLEPDGTGNYSDFEGGYVELSDDDLATAAATGTAADRVSSTVTYSGPSSAGGIRAVIAKCVATKGDTGPATLTQFLRISSTDYDGSGEALTVDNTAYMEEWATNPATATGWSTTDLAGIEVGVLSGV